MNIDLKKMTQDEKISFFSAIAALASFVFPWWGTSYETNINAMGQDFNSAGSQSLNGFQMDIGFLGFLAAAGALYFIIEKQKYSLWCVVACILYAVNIYFGILGSNKMDLSVSYGGYGGASVNSGYKFGFYLFVVASLILLYVEAKRSGILKSVIIEVDGSSKKEIKTTTEEKPKTDTE